MPHFDFMSHDKPGDALIIMTRSVAVTIHGPVNLLQLTFYFLFLFMLDCVKRPTRMSPVDARPLMPLPVSDVFTHVTSHDTFKAHNYVASVNVCDPTPICKSHSMVLPRPNGLPRHSFSETIKVSSCYGNLYCCHGNTTVAMVMSCYHGNRVVAVINVVMTAQKFW